MSIARRREMAPDRAASEDEFFCSRRLRSAKDTSRIELATAMPMAMMAPMNDCTLRVVPVIESIMSTPQSTAGVVRTTASARRKD